jgi:glycosyltransferase involved in cell wall biosynthesis
MAKITIILCTFNRCQNLAKALDSVARTTLPESEEWEVIVVDNNSGDQTREVVEDFIRRYPGRFRYLFEPHQGLSHARNAGIRGARGDVLAFMDDDVTVESAWLRNLTADLCSGEWAGAGGRILPRWPCTPPSWLPVKEWYGMAPLVMFDLGLEPGPLTDAPFGTNMAFHRRVFEKYGGFRTDLDRCGDDLMTGGDTEFGRRLLAAGERLKYEPTAVVHHPVPQNRLQRDYFLRWWFNKGRAEIREFGVAADTKWFVSGIPLYLFRKLAVGTLRWMVTLEPPQRFTCRLTVWLLAGMIAESYRRWWEVRHKREKHPRV